MTARIRHLIMLLGLLGVSASVWHAQTIRGAVQNDVSGEMVAGAAVLLTDMHGVVLAATRSAADGSFVLRSTAGDTIRVSVERPGYAGVQTQPWILKGGSTLELQLRLRPAALALDTITVVAQRQSHNRAAFEARRTSEAAGRFIDAERLSRVRTPSASQRLAAVIPRVIVAADGTVRVRKRGVDVNGSPTCQPRFYIDGARFPGDMSIDAIVQGPTIRAVEFYVDPRFAPAEYAMGADAMVSTGLSPATGKIESGMGLSPPCAVIVIWTEFGFGKG